MPLNDERNRQALAQMLGEQIRHHHDQDEREQAREDKGVRLDKTWLPISAVIAVIIFGGGGIWGVGAAFASYNRRLDTVEKQFTELHQHTWTKAMMRVYVHDGMSMNPNVKYPDVDSIVDRIEK